MRTCGPSTTRTRSPPPTTRSRPSPPTPSGARPCSRSPELRAGPEGPAEALGLRRLGLRLAPVQDGGVVRARRQPADLLALAGPERDRAGGVVDQELILGDALPVEHDHAGQTGPEADLDAVELVRDAPGRRSHLGDVRVRVLLPLIRRVGVVSQDEHEADDERQAPDDDHHAPRMDARPTTARRATAHELGSA